MSHWEMQAICFSMHSSVNVRLNFQISSLHFPVGYYVVLLISSYYILRFSVFSFSDMVRESGTRALQDAKLSYENVDVAIASYCYGEPTAGQYFIPFSYYKMM